MPGPNRRFDDPGRVGESDPRVALGVLIAQVEILNRTAESNTDLIGRIADDVLEIKLARAKESGQKQGFLSVANLMQAVMVVSAGVITAWATVKSMVISLPPSHS